MLTSILSLPGLPPGGVTRANGAPLLLSAANPIAMPVSSFAFSGVSLLAFGVALATGVAIGGLWLARRDELAANAKLRRVFRLSLLVGAAAFALAVVLALVSPI
jgi:hypothetical protein